MEPVHVAPEDDLVNIAHVVPGELGATLLLRQALRRPALLLHLNGQRRCKRLLCGGWAPSGTAAASECRAAQSREARSEEAAGPS